MEFSLDGLFVLLHVLFAALWFGGGAFQVLMIGPTLRQAGPAAGGFMVTLMKRGGIGRYFAITGGLTILFGGILYYREKIGSAPFEGSNMFVTLGAILAVLTYLHGMTSNLPTEKKLERLVKELKGPPTADQQAQMAALGAKLGKAGAVSVAMLTVAILLMLLRRAYF